MKNGGIGSLQKAQNASVLDELAFLIGEKNDWENVPNLR
jgi:hypothetical protein